VKITLKRGRGKINMATIVKAKELGQFLKLSESTVYKLVKEGVLPGFKIGDSWRFDLDEVSTMIEKSKNVNHRKTKKL
jgi:excisionase family DNA binding protein